MLTPIQNIIEVSRSSQELHTVEKLKQNHDMVFNTAQTILFQVNLSLKYFSNGNIDTQKQMVLCDIRKLEKNALKVLQPQAKLRGINFYNMDIVTGKTVVSIDKSRIDQILYYLIVNAIHRNRLGGNIVIKKDEHRTGTHRTTLVIQIIDDGPGIDLPDQELIFKPIKSLTLRQLRKPHIQRLNLSNHLIRQLGGRLTISSGEDSDQRDSDTKVTIEVEA